MSKIRIIDATTSPWSAAIALAVKSDPVVRLSDIAPVSLRATAGGEGEAKWNRLIPLGMVGYRADFPGGKIEFTREYLATMLANWEREGRLPKQVNYLHRGDTSHDDLPLEEKVAAGWMEDFALRDDGLWALIKWTKRAKQRIDDDELRYLSPEFHPNGFDRSTGKTQGPTLGGCALLNDPYITNQQRVAAGNTPSPNAADAAETNMNWKTMLIGILALAATASDTDIEAALKKQKEDLDKAKAESLELTAKLTEATTKIDLANKAGGDVVQLRAANAELHTQLAASNARITAIETEAKTKEIDGYITDKVKAGVLIPAMVPGVKAMALSGGLPAVKAIYDVAPVLNKMGESGITGEQKQLSANDARIKFNAAVAELAKAQGIKSSEAKDIVIREQPELARAAFNRA